MSKIKLVTSEMTSERSNAEVIGDLDVGNY